jgi:hypothetical protein
MAYYVSFLPLRETKMLEKIKSVSFLVFVNVAIISAIIGVITFFVPAVVDIAHMLKRKQSTTFIDLRASLPIYSNQVWAQQHFREFQELKTLYYDFIGWRRLPYRGHTITVDDEGYRRHDLETSFQAADIWFFGGSTTWGTGATDETTIPALVQEKVRLSSFNFGESGYVSHQNLNLLQKAYISGARPKFVVFYDGANDVSHKCRVEADYFSSGREVQIRDLIEKAKSVTGGKYYLTRVFEPILDLVKELRGTPDVAVATKEKLFNCAAQPEKADRITEIWFRDWQAAKTLVESNGGTFIGILQPVAYFGTPDLSYLTELTKFSDFFPGNREEFQAVYGRLRRRLAQENFDYTDLTGAFDNKAAVYSDFCHVSPEGNKIIADSIAEIISKKASAPAHLKINHQ